MAFVSPYNDPVVVAGQATIGRELDDLAAGEVTVVAPVGGGGLLAGLALWARSRPGVHLAGVESSRSRGLSASVAAGRVVSVPVGDTVADGLAGNLEPGSITPGLVEGSQLVAVDEEELASRDALALQEPRPRRRGLGRSRGRRCPRRQDQVDGQARSNRLRAQHLSRALRGDHPGRVRERILWTAATAEGRASEADRFNPPRKSRIGSGSVRVEVCALADLVRRRMDRAGVALDAFGRSTSSSRASRVPHVKVGRGAVILPSGRARRGRARRGRRRDGPRRWRPTLALPNPYSSPSS